MADPGSFRKNQPFTLVFHPFKFQTVHHASCRQHCDSPSLADNLVFRHGSHLWVLQIRFLSDALSHIFRTLLYQNGKSQRLVRSNSLNKRSS